MPADAARHSAERIVEDAVWCKVFGEIVDSGSVVRANGGVAARRVRDKSSRRW